MKAFNKKVLYSLIGASSGLSGLAAMARCPGGGCTSCYGCAGVGAGVVVMILLSRLKGGDQKNGMA